MKNSILILLAVLAIAAIACGQTVNIPDKLPTPEPAPAAVFAPVNVRATPTDPPILSRLPFATGTLYIREQATTSAKVLGHYEPGEAVELTGAEVVDAASTECKQWYGVKWRGLDGWVCAAWVAR
jgi:hypothetical protein